MSGSKIVEALARFKADYAWDKSLSADSEPPTPAPSIAAAKPLVDPLEQFLAEHAERNASVVSCKS